LHLLLLLELLLHLLLMPLEIKVVEAGEPGVRSRMSGMSWKRWPWVAHLMLLLLHMLLLEGKVLLLLLLLLLIALFLHIHTVIIFFVFSVLLHVGHVLLGHLLQFGHSFSARGRKEMG